MISNTNYTINIISKPNYTISIISNTNYIIRWWLAEVLSALTKLCSSL